MEGRLSPRSKQTAQRGGRFKSFCIQNFLLAKEISPETKPASCGLSLKKICNDVLAKTDALNVLSKKARHCVTMTSPTLHFLTSANMSSV